MNSSWLSGLAWAGWTVTVVAGAGCLPSFPPDTSNQDGGSADTTSGALDGGSTGQETGTTTPLDADVKGLTEAGGSTAAFEGGAEDDGGSDAPIDTRPTGCTIDGNCTAPAPYCDSANGRCYATAPQGHSCTSGTTSCMAGTSCLDGVCCEAPACPAIDSCHSVGVCMAGTGTCTTPAVVNDTPCGTDRTCTSGICGCASGYSSCASQCVDVQTDLDNCGGCGKKCSDVQQCATGSCQSIPETLTVAFHGLGGQTATITSSPTGISCGTTSCTSTASFVLGSTVTLTVTQASNALIAWSNGCTGRTCIVPINGATTVNVTTTTKNIVFISSQAHSADFGGVAGASTFCDSLAAAAGVPGHFAAFLSTTTASEFLPLGSARGWIRPDGLPFTDTLSGFESGVMWYPADLNEVGALVNVPFYTGQVGSVLASADDPMLTCNDWTTDAGSGGTGGYSPMDSGINFYGIVQMDCSGGPIACFGTDFSLQVSLTPITGRHVFASSEGFSPTGGIAAADAFCQEAATSAGLANASHFLALLSTTKASAASRLNLDGAIWVRTDGVPVVTSTANFGPGTLIAPVSVNENGAPYDPPSGSSPAWIGSLGGALQPAGSANESCNDWSTAGSSVTGAVAYPDYDSIRAFSNQVPDPCNMTLPLPSLYCVEN